MTEVKKEQFEVHGIQVKHRPTGAVVRWGSDGRSHYEFMKGRAGEVLENGEVYDEYQVKVEGISLLEVERARRRC